MVKWFGILGIGFAVGAFAVPMIDDSHDRVQTTLDPPLERVGTLVPRSASEIGPSRLALGCEMLPRGYGDFEAFKEYVPPLGIARVRLHAGWAKLEPEPGRWDFEWLDRQVNWLIEQGLEPLLETSYGNPIYPGAGGASLSDGIPKGEVALAAWDNYVERLARRYSQVKNWACWNEPNNNPALNPPELVADNNVRTARIIKRHIPDAKIGMLSLSWCDLKYTKACFKVFKEQDALGLFHWAIMHDYSPNPDVYYEGLAKPWAEFVRKEAPHLVVWNGESGATSAPHFSAPISSMKWNSELTQAKWDARRLVADLGHGFDSLVFTMYDPCYDDPGRYCNEVKPYWVMSRKDRFMKRMGLVKCNDRNQVVKVKPAYYTVQNVATLFDATIEPANISVKTVSGEKAPGLVTYTFRQKGTKIPLIAFWDASNHPGNENELRQVSLDVRAAPLKEPVWVDLVTGAIYEVPDRMVVGKTKPNRVYEGLPYYDAPAVLTERSLVMKGEGEEEAAVNAAWDRMMAERWSAKTGLIYSTRLQNVKKANTFTNGLFRWSKDSKEGYGAGMGDCSIVSGMGLAAICDRHAVTGEESMREEAEKVARGLVTNATAHGYRGFVARGVCEEDGRSICALSSIDQFTHWFHGLWHYAKGPLCPRERRDQIAGLFVEVMERIERVATASNGYNFAQADGEADPRGICTLWRDLPAKEWKTVHGATRLPMFYAATWDLTHDGRWRDGYERYIDRALEVNLRLRDENADRWKGAMPTYSLLQMACANEVLMAIETDAKRKAALADCLRAGARVADGRAKEMLKNPAKKWYGMCPDAELALAMLYAPGFDFDAEEQSILKDRLEKLTPSSSLAVTHYAAAYWRWRRISR